MAFIVPWFRPRLIGWEFEIGDVIWLRALRFYGRFGSLAHRLVTPQGDRWVVRLEKTWLGRREVTVLEHYMIPWVPPRLWLEPGKRVVTVRTGRRDVVPEGLRGTLIRKTRLFGWWLIELDQRFGGLHRLRRAAGGLAPTPEDFAAIRRRRRDESSESPT